MKLFGREFGRSAACKQLFTDVKQMHKAGQYQAVVDLLSTDDSVRCVEDSDNDKQLRLYYRACAYNQLGKRDLAIDDFTQAAALKPNSSSTVKVYRDHAYLLADDESCKEALHLISLAIRLEPYNLRLCRSRGYILLNHGKYQEAAKDFYSVITASVLQVDAIEVMKSYLGSLLCIFGAGDYDRVVRLYENKIASRDLDNELEKHERGLLYHHVALSYSKKKSRPDNNKAIECFTKSIESDASNAKAYFNRAKLYLNMQKIDQAKNDFTKAYQLMPDVDVNESWLMFVDRAILHDSVSPVSEESKSDSENSGNEVISPVKAYPVIDMALWVGAYKAASACSDERECFCSLQDLIDNISAEITRGGLESNDEQSLRKLRQRCQEDQALLDVQLGVPVFR